jgi:gliding motility-associated-like protein
MTLSSNTVNNYVAQICGNGITFSNATLTGDPTAIASFLGGTSAGIGASMNSGVVLSTGAVNTPTVLQGGPGGFASTNNTGGSITALNTIAGATTFDGIILEFDFIPITGNINVNYVFGSEEYNEFVNSGYNDAFAFFISGPGIVGSQNIAVIGGNPVTIDNVNNFSNTGSYRDNTVLNNPNKMDGYTAQLTAARAVIACQTYHIQLMIADGGDAVYDSWVFIQENGLFAVGNPPVSSVTSSGAGPGIFPEGCGNNTMTFNIPSPQATPYTFNVSWSGTATSGVDYSSLPTTITIPAGQTSVTIPVNVTLDGITEGNETLICTYPATVCTTGSVSMTIIDAAPLTVVASPDVTLCTPGSTSLSATSSGGTGTVTYTWSNGAGTGTPVNVSPVTTTTYTVTATDLCGGTATDQVIVNYAVLPAPTVTPTAESCNNYNNGSVIINNPVGAGPYTVSISGPTTGSVTEANTAAATASFTNLPDGTYTYTVLATNGCTRTGTFTIAPGPVCCSVTATNTNILCNGSTTGSATASPVGLAPYTYSWTGGQTSQTATNLPAGSYTVTMTDNSGCTATASVTVTQPTALTGSLTPVQVTCNGVCNGSIAVTASGGTAPYQYSINGGAYQASNSFTGLCAGSYVVTIRDANNCTITLNQTITQPAILNLTQTAITQATCGVNNGTVTVSASGGTAAYQYSIDGGANQAGTTFSGLSAGPHVVTVTDANGCTRTLNITITATNSPTATIQTQTNVSCFGGVNGSVIIGVSGGSSPFTYDINPGPTQASNTFTNLVAGTYTVIVTDANGCQATSPTITITSPPQLTFTSTPTSPTCNGVCNGQILANVSGGMPPYQYSSNNGTTFQLANPMTGLCAGTISVVIQDANGCIANANVNITQPTPLAATFTNTNPICNGACDGTITVNASGGTPTYQYSLNGGALQASNLINGACGGGNTILIQDANGCQMTSIQTLIDPPGFGINQTLVVESNCGFNNGSITVSANGTNGPFTYTMTTPLITNTTGSFTNLFGGAYEITAVDALGCSESVFFGINDVEMDGITLSQSDATCFSSCDGTIEVQNVSGAPPITYELNNSGATQASGFFPGICEGSGVVTIYDGGFCVFTIPFNTSQPAEIQFSTTITDVSCSGGSTGGIQFTGVSGGTGTHQFSIDGGNNFQTGASFTGLPAGTYDLVVMDDNGCTVFGTAVIDQAPPLTIASTVFDLTCFDDASGLIQIAGTGGTGAYQFSIDNGNTFSPIESFFNLDAGTYDLMIQDAAGCQITSSVNVNQPSQLTATYAASPANCNDVCDGEIVITASGATPPYLYSPDNGLNFFVSNTLTGLCAGNVDIRVKDDNGCFINAVEVITEPTAVTFTTVLTDETCSAANGQIAITASGGTPGYTYSNNNGAFGPTPTFTGLVAGNYDLDVMDANNCLVEATVSILNEASPIIIGAAVTNVNCNTACDGQLQVTTSGGTGTLSYSIGAPQASSTFTNICAGNYTLTITDQNGCTDTEPIVVTEPPTLLVTVNSTNLNCFNDNSGTIDITAAGGTPPYMYSIDNGATYSTQNNFQFLAAGTYNIVVTDANGCSGTNITICDQPTELLIPTGVTTTDATCYGSCDGTATVIPSGGTMPYNYLWLNSTSGTNTINGLCVGSYDLEITDDNGCVITAIFDIQEPPALVITDITETDALCNGSCDGTVTITSPLAVNFSIDNGATYQSSNNFTGLCTGTYPIIVQDLNGCEQSGSISIGEPTPVIQSVIPEDGSAICLNGSISLTGNATGGTAPYSFIWNTGDTSQYLNVTLSTPTNFSCTVVDANGCVAANIENASIGIIPPFNAAVTTPLSVCTGDTVTFTASGFDGVQGNGYDYSYYWYTPGNMSLINVGSTYSFVPNANQSVVMIAFDECQTYDTLTAEVNVLALPNPTFTVTPASGCSPLTADFTLNAQTNGATITSATWDFGDGATGTGVSNVSHVYTPVGCYDVYVEVLSSNGCTSDTTLNNVVCVVPDPVANFTWNPVQPTTIETFVHFYDASTNAISYSWDFGTYGTSSAENPSVNYDNIEASTQTVCLTVTSPEGCTNQICKPIVFIDELVIYVPNTFTPDGDEFNNTFKPVIPNGTVVDSYTLTIYNRWGEVLFESHDTNVGWDGTYRNEIVKEGVYIWTIVITGGDLKKPKKMEGHVNMLK